MLDAARCRRLLRYLGHDAPGFGLLLALKCYVFGRKCCVFGTGCFVFGIPPHPTKPSLKRGLVFFEPSTRTRTSFELAAKRLSADTVNVSSSTSSLSTHPGVPPPAQASPSRPLPRHPMPPATRCSGSVNKLIFHSLTFVPCIYYNGESC